MADCTESSEACNYSEHWKCDGKYICPDGWGLEYCVCRCHSEGNEKMRNRRD